MPYALITGAHGFIGRHLARFLQNNNYDVAGLGHGTWPKEIAAKWGISYWLNGDISASNLNQVHQVKGIPDVVYHLAGGSSVGAAMAHPHEDFMRTVLSTAVLLEWLRQRTAESHLVAISSAAVYGADHKGPILENARLLPSSSYGSHKMMMEELCLSYAANYRIKIVIPRLFSVYGTGLRKQLLWDLCSKIASGNSVKLGGTGDEMRDWINIQDVVHSLEVISQLASSDAPIVNIASGTPATVREIAKIVAKEWAPSINNIHEITFSGKVRPGDPFSLTADITKLRKYDTKLFTPLEQGIANYVDWYRTQ